jgi:response regulator of citrate/malate metabolism
LAFATLTAPEETPMAINSDYGAQLATELRQLIVLEEAQLRERHDKIRQAIEQLTAQTEPVAPEPAANGSISEKMLTRVLAGVRSEAEPFTRNKLAQRVGVAPETIRKALEVLRERGTVRLVAVTKQGGKLYALMPDAD